MKRRSGGAESDGFYQCGSDFVAMVNFEELLIVLSKLGIFFTFS
jgi:hypothetical protein